MIFQTKNGEPMNDSIINIGVFVIMIGVFLGIAFFYRYVLNKVQTEDKKSEEFGPLAELKSAERMKHYYATILILVAIVLIYLPNQIAPKRIGQIIILFIGFSGLAEKIFRRKITKDEKRYLPKVPYTFVLN